MKGRLGEDETDLKEIRVLNRILRITADGLRYDADPRHVELLSRSMQVQHHRRISTPGIKWLEDLEYGPEEEEHVDHDAMNLDDDDDFDKFKSLVCASIQSRSPSERIKSVVVDGHEQEKLSQRVAVDDVPVVYEIVPYSKIYPYHPRQFVIVGPICGSLGRPHQSELPEIRLLSAHANPFTGKIATVLARRNKSLERHPDYRLPSLRRTLLDGPAWEPDTCKILERFDKICIAAKHKKPVYKQKRLGAKQVKTLERLESKGEALNSEESTLYRALAARANYLALDRPDIGQHKRIVQGLQRARKALRPEIAPFGQVPLP